jgi:hypothetical protein
MVTRTFAAFDNEAFTVVSSSSSNLNTGDAIINNSSTPTGTIFEFSSGFGFETITLDDTSSDPDIFNDDDEGNHTITDGQGLVADGTEVESESFHYVRALDDNGDPTGPTITITVFSQNGQTSNIWGMASDTELVSGTQYIKTGGSNRGDSEYETFVPCFTAGTMIATSTGLRAVESLKAGDMIMTRDNGLQELRWSSSRALKAVDIANDANLAPIEIKAATLGFDTDTSLILSANHNVLLTGPVLDLNFGTNEIFAPVKHLIGLDGVRVLEAQDITYVHLLFKSHQVVLGNDIWSESFQPGAVSLDGIGKAQAQEVFTLFPELQDNIDGYENARRFMTRHEAAVYQMAVQP